MTAVREVFLYCDGQGCKNWTDGGGYTNERVSDVRRHVRDREDWHFNAKTGHDVCPKCWTAGHR